MRNHFGTALLIAFALGRAGAQQSPPDNSQDRPPAPERVTVFSAGPGFTPPALVPLAPLELATEKCKENVEGKVLLSLIVDSSGHPRNLWFLHALGNDLDRLALQIAATNQFTPGTSNGIPVAFAQSLEMSLQACVFAVKDTSGTEGSRLQLRSQPSQSLQPPTRPPREAILTTGPSWSDSPTRPPRTEQVGGKISGPVPVLSPPAEYSKEARRAKYQGVCILALIVDRNGLPQNVKITRTLDHGLGLKAIEAANRYRFKPAMKDGEPVPVYVNIEVSFMLY